MESFRPLVEYQLQRRRKKIGTVESEGGPAPLQQTLVDYLPKSAQTGTCETASWTVLATCYRNKRSLSAKKGHDGT